MRLCFYTGTNKPFKEGTILRRLGDELIRRGHTVTHTSDSHPDVYILEAVWPTRMPDDAPVIVHAENLLGRDARERHAWNKGAAIVFNSQWLRTLYRNTYHGEHFKAVVIPPAFDARTAAGCPPPLSEEVIIACCSKWSKRPYKRLPLHVAAVEVLRTIGYPQARLHIMGWEPTMPFYHTPPYFWRNMAIGHARIHQRSFFRPTWPELLARTHVLLHLSAIDSGPQVVMEGLSRGIPVVCSNNMGGAEWVRDIGGAGIVIDIDPMTDQYSQVQALTDPRFFGPHWRWHRAMHPRKYAQFHEVCANRSHAGMAAEAIKRVLAWGAARRFVPPPRYTMEGVAEAWETLIQTVR